MRTPSISLRRGGLLLRHPTKLTGPIAWLLSSALTTLAGEPWTLERALACARENNPETRLAVQRIVAAQAGLELANAAAWPRLQLGSGYLRTDNPMMVFGSLLNQRAFSPTLNFNHVPDMDNLNVKGLLSVPLYTGGALTAGREGARANTEAAKYDAQAVDNALAFEVSRAFYTVLKAREFIRAAEASVKSFDSNAAIARRRVEAGTLLRAELLEVEVCQSQALEGLLRARNANALAERTLRNLLGIEHGEFTVADTAPAVTAPDSGDFSSRPELAQAKQLQRAAQSQVRGARSSYFPSVNAFGSLDHDSGWVANGEGRSYSAGLMVQLNLWDGRLTRAKVREAEARSDQVRESERKLRLDLDLELEQARLNLKDANERLIVTARTVTQATESALLTHARFGEGLAIATQLIDAETALTAARVRHAEAQADQRIAIAAVRKALGLPQLDSQ